MTLSLQFRDNFPNRQVYGISHGAGCGRDVNPAGKHSHSERVLDLQATN